MPTRKEDRDAQTPRREPKRSFSGQGSSETNAPTRVFRQAAIKAEKEFNRNCLSPTIAGCEFKLERGAEGIHHFFCLPVLSRNPAG